MKFVTAYGPHDPEDFAVFFDEPSLTHQSMSADCDINNIMKRYDKTGIIDHVAQYEGNYGDFVNGGDYLHALLEVQQAQEMFFSLPADIRSRFENEPSKFLDFVEDPSNRSEMARMGLLAPEVAQEVLAAETPPGPSSEAARSEP